MKYCSNCGEELAPGAKFCANCGNAVVAPVTVDATKPTPGAPTPKASAVPPVPPPPRGRSTWWILPAVIIGIIVIVFLILVGLPFGRSNTIEREQAPFDTIGEATTTQPPSATIVDATSATTTDAMPPMVTQTMPPTMMTQTAPPPQVTQTVPPPAATAPPPAATTPPPQAPRQGEISERDAAAILRRAAGSYYDDVSSDCIEIRSHGYQNEGYTMTVWNSCASGGIRMLGRWRVDSEKGEVFRQREDGRYLEP